MREKNYRIILLLTVIILATLLSCTIKQPRKVGTEPPSSGVAPSEIKREQTLTPKVTPEETKGKILEKIEAKLTSAKVKTPDVRREEFDNGLVSLVLERRDIPIVYAQIQFKFAGSAYEPEDKAGLSNLVAQLLRQGTQTKSALEISSQIDFVGGSLTTSSNFDTTSASVTVLQKDFDLGLDLLADIILHPAFDASEIDKKKKQIVSAIVAAKDEPRRVAAKAFNEVVFGKHPYHRPVKGYEDTVQKITRDEIVAFHDQFYRPNNAIIAVVGDIATEDAMAKIKTRFGAWEKRELNLPGLPQAPKPEKHLLRLINKDVTQTTIYFGNVGMKRMNPDFYPAILMNYILGGSSVSSRVGKEVRNKQGLAYSVWTRFRARWFPGPFYAFVQTKNEDAHRSIQSILAEIKRIQTELVTDAELRHAKSYFNGSFPLRFESNRDVAYILLFSEHHGIGVKYFTEYLERINAVTKEDIKRVAKQYIDAENFVLVAVTRVDETKDNFTLLGEVEVQ